MNTNAQHMDLDRLLAERDWLIRLSRQLVRAGEDAEEFAQATLSNALEDQVVGTQGARTWLARGLGSLLSEGRRSDARRRRRERAAAQEERLPSTAEAVERASLRRDLADMVLALDTVEREAVILRFYEGLEYTDIAERVGDLVRGRTRQGLRLRGRALR